LWEITEKRVIAERLRVGGTLSSQAADESMADQMNPVWLSNLCPGALSQGVQGGPMEKLHDLRANVVTKNKRTQAASPDRDRKDLSCLAWFSLPRGTATTTRVRREKKELRRKRHGSARAIEDLRGLRKPFLPHGREYLLSML
jgi:hypothetical protein